ncbi:MAG TPA: hypothetical protein DDX47_05930 [Candidatus Jacksonbacteria bacterium]|nr:MAG: hypothetical protein A2295_00295 [Candidatus Jacksonbacteria bacterium RIFOXYB2_FULL_44_15]HBH46871.1 hypothetical protein [Candidatus Jacksonbacteria bacterium]HCR15488.1 hypothetical protein [Candidatus Jacksonbacteria bacterium]
MRRGQYSVKTINFKRPDRAFFCVAVAFFSAFFRQLRKAPWEAIGIGCVLLLVLGGLPIIIFMMKGIPIGSIKGIAAAGAVVGVIGAPIVGRLRKSWGAGLLTIPCSSYGAVILVVLMIVMASD